MNTRLWGIIFYRTLAGIKAESRQNYLGYIWYLLEPAFSAVVFYLAFSHVMGRGLEAVMFLLIGLTVWQWYEGTCLAAAGAIKAKLHILQHFDLPKHLFPLVTVCVSTWKFFCVFGVTVAGYLLFGGGAGTGWNLLWLPLVLACQFLLIASSSIPLSIAATYVNDTLTLAASVFRIMFFVSGIYFPSHLVPERLQGLFYANPMAGLIESYRFVLLYGQPPNFYALLYCAALSAGWLGFGLLLSSYVNRRILKHASL
jgi:ABC-type polysaccharide/polyol phosphate export permease